MIPESDMITTFIQIAVAPVFLLAGVAGMLNVFTGRLARIMDRLERMDLHLHSNLPEKLLDINSSLIDSVGIPGSTVDYETKIPPIFFKYTIMVHIVPTRFLE